VYVTQTGCCCCLLLPLQGTSAHDGRPVVRQRTYPVLAGIRWGAVFLPAVTPHAPGSGASRASGRRDGGGAAARVEWSAFHCTMPAQVGVASLLTAAALLPSHMCEICDYECVANRGAGCSTAACMVMNVRGMPLYVFMPADGCCGPIGRQHHTRCDVWCCGGGHTSQ
jgi:hypothetical protein